MNATTLVHVLHVLPNLLHDVNHGFDVHPGHSIMREEVAEVLLCIGHHNEVRPRID